ncbi:MAG: BlaI/MecI/CopY family transcriptional regulator [Lachnospiraceae bacterium]|nr:BlaI/MecI/CopY family transcriptional regulator [Lachnospiraceae bacterium]
MDKMTDVELQIMECIWFREVPVSPAEILSLLNERYGRNWTLQTLCTYLLRMAGKGYLKYQKNHRQTLYTPLISEEEYFEFATFDYTSFWGKGVLKRMAVGMVKRNQLSQEEVQDLRDYLDELVR